MQKRQIPDTTIILPSHIDIHLSIVTHCRREMSVGCDDGRFISPKECET